ncbi:hypothetical protein SAMN05444678_12430 [Sphingomonas sp. YR710]|uniref:hypothetical protein n=1 Tax=Sphingomonas sp. YR710 TaxID=1882773 RepID=UPI000884DB25|nr:hypothetical protein [Sphingomonas sp. YR710]SDD82447.1 hypothetical protein SAMN05444678_12430 [Sphingomonas sp. YR710]
MVKLEEFLDVAGPPSVLKAEWLQGASSGVEYLVRNSRSEEIIIFTNAGQMLAHSVLVPLAGVTPPDGHALQYSTIDPTAHWALEHVSGGGEPDRMYLSPPVDSYGCDSLRGAEQLVFRRYFDGVDNGPTRTELSQPLVQALGLYWLDEEKAYCKLDEDGDIQPIIRLRDLSQQTGEDSAMLVTIDAEQLHRYMAVTETALLTKFDFTRYAPKSFSGWGEPERDEINENDLFYHTGVQANGSFANGAIIVRPVLTKDMLISKANRAWRKEDKQYATFKAHDWRNKRQAELSCAPWALASYFDEGSDLPFQVTPAFFRPEVLQKYKSDPDKYRLEHRSIHARGGWHLKSYDVNEAGQVHAYLYDLANLPYREQLYWQSFNEWPKAPISPRAYQTDFEGSFSTIPDPLIDLKHEISKLDKIKPDYWQSRGEALAGAVHYPLTASTEEWANAILALDQLVVEGFATKPLRQRLTAAGREFDKQWGSLKLLQEVLIAGGSDEDDVIEIVAPLRRLHDIRSKAKGHAAEAEKRALVKLAKTEHGSLPAHFRALTSNTQVSFNRIVELL